MKTPLCWLGLFALAAPAFGQWTQETYSLQPGWNGIYALNDSSHVSLDTLLANHTAISKVWRWVPSNLSSKFIGDPTETVSDQEWKTWIRGEPANSTMTSLLPNHGYLVFVTGGSSISLPLTGKAVVNQLNWRSSGANLLGFPSSVSPAPRFGNTTTGYLAPLASSGYNPATTQIFQYVGGAISSTNPSQVFSPANALITRGKAYWINLGIHSEFVSPVQLSLSDLTGLHFGTRGMTKRVSVKNTSSSSLTVTLTPSASLPAPVGQTAIAGQVPLLRQVWNETSLSFEYQPVTGPLSATLAAGASASWTLIPNRTAMSGSVGSLYASVLRVTDSANYSDLTIPASAEVSGLGGLWIGQASVTNVNNQHQRYERDANGNTRFDESGQPIPLGPFSTDSQTAQAFPLRIILHVNSNGTARLLSNVYHGMLDTVPPSLGFATRQARLKADSLASAVRITATHLPLDVNVAFPDTFAIGGSYNASVPLPHNDPTNPFLHTYHPDHDNLNQRFNSATPLAAGVESYTVNRAITLTVDASSPSNDPGWGSRSLTGLYAETVTGLHKNPIQVSGRFELKRLSEIATALAQ